MSLTAKGRRLVQRVADHRRRDLANIVSSMSQKDLGQVIKSLTSFSIAADEPPGVDRFGWADYLGKGEPIPPQTI